MSNTDNKQYLDRLEKVLSKLNVDSYRSLSASDDTIVVLGRLKPLNETDSNLRQAESRLLNFITDVLKIASTMSNWQVRFSRPWLLKEGKLAFTWDFTVRGNLDDALRNIESVKIPVMRISEEVEVPIRPVKKTKAKVSQVRVKK